MPGLECLNGLLVIWVDVFPGPSELHRILEGNTVGRTDLCSGENTQEPNIAVLRCRYMVNVGPKQNADSRMCGGPVLKLLSGLDFDCFF